MAIGLISEKHTMTGATNPATYDDWRQASHAPVIRRSSITSKPYCALQYIRTVPRTFAASAPALSLDVQVFERKKR